MKLNNIIMDIKTRLRRTDPQWHCRPARLATAVLEICSLQSVKSIREGAV
jgi:hypothetical protein